MRILGSFIGAILLVGFSHGFVSAQAAETFLQPVGQSASQSTDQPGAQPPGTPVQSSPRPASPVASQGPAESPQALAPSASQPAAPDASQAPVQTSAQPAVQSSPAQQIINVGPLTIMPRTSTITFIQDGLSVKIIPTIRFRVMNSSKDKVSVILIGDSINATDNLGQVLLKSPLTNSTWVTSSGLLTSGSKDLKQVFNDDIGSFSAIYPGQFCDVQLALNKAYEVKDVKKSFIETHKPTTVDLTASLGVILQDKSTGVMPLTLPDIPVYVESR